MAAIIAWLIGLLFVGIGAWILLLRFEGLVDLVRPHNMSIGQMTVDGQESKGYAELLRARFDHHFRRPIALPKETGFLEVVSLDAPGLFQADGLKGALKDVTVEVSGVDVSKLLRFINQIAKPDQWVVEGDFQSQPERARLALRLRRGQRLIRTWYLAQEARPSEDKSVVLERLIDDAIFQLVYDFGNEAEENKDIRKWRHVVPVPTRFPSRTAIAAYYEARGALSRYYAHGDWNDLDRALERLRTLRSQMPEYADGLQLLGIALAEKRRETEAIHVFQHLRSILLPVEEGWNQLKPNEKRRLLSIDLLRATATAKLYRWLSAHHAIEQLSDLDRAIEIEEASAQTDRERAGYGELRAQTAAQLAYTHALYLAYLRHFTVGDVLGSGEAPETLRISDPETLRILREGPPAEAKQIVLRTILEVARLHQTWIDKVKDRQAALERQWSHLPDGDRRKAELAARLHLASGYAHYRMAEWENHEAPKDRTVFGEIFETRLGLAAAELRKADATHPNHYMVLQLLGLVFSEPRLKGSDLSVAEQYFERAIEANPSDYYGHQLLASLLLRTLGNTGVDLASLDTIKKGLEEAQSAVEEREISGSAHLLRAEFQLLLLEVETDNDERVRLRAGLDRYLSQAERFLPRAFQRPTPDLTWLRIVAATRRMGEEAEAVKPTQAGEDVEKQRQTLFAQSKKRLERQIVELMDDCDLLERRWFAQQRVFQVLELKERAERLNAAIENATLENWREIPTPFP